MDTGGTTADEEQVLFAGAIVGEKKAAIMVAVWKRKTTIPYHTIPYHMPTRFPYDTSAACRARYLWLQRRSYVKRRKAVL